MMITIRRFAVFNMIYRNILTSNISYLFLRIIDVGNFDIIIHDSQKIRELTRNILGDITK